MKRQDKLQKNDKLKSNKHTKTDFHSNCSKINQYQNLEPGEKNDTAGLDPTTYYPYYLLFKRKIIKILIITLMIIIVLIIIVINILLTLRKIDNGKMQYGLCKKNLRKLKC